MPATSHQTKENRSSIKDSKSQLRNIAQAFAIDAQLHDITPSTNLLERALLREQKQKEQRQKNLENIIALTNQSCFDETAGNPDHDWLDRFFTLAQYIHNPSMQRLWAQVLKREITNPGSTSLKSLALLKELVPKEAQYLQRAAALACSFGSDHSKRLLLGYKTPHGLFYFGKRDSSNIVNLGSLGLPYSKLLLLIELGILQSTEFESGELNLEPALNVNYQGQSLAIQPHSKGIKLLYYRFTPVGNELCSLLGFNINNDYFAQLTHLLEQKFTLLEELPNTSVNYTV